VAVGADPLLALDQFVHDGPTIFHAATLQARDRVGTGDRTVENRRYVAERRRLVRAARVRVAAQAAFAPLRTEERTMDEERERNDPNETQPRRAYGNRRRAGRTAAPRAS